MSTTDKAIWVALTLPTVFFAAVVWCLSLGGVVGTAAAMIFLLFMLVAAIPLLGSVLYPKDVGALLAVVIKEDKKEIDPSKWDGYISLFENRSATIAFWVTMVWQLVLLSGLIYYGPMYISVSYTILIGLDEIAKYRVYTAIKRNKQVWGASTYMTAMQKELNRAINEEKEDKSC